ncbi:MAG: LysR family transcriptional regulator [Pseudomonadota bacterium]
MQIHQIRYFLAVCETLNFTKAAERCHVSQPSLTRAIKNLEAELGGSLFHRETRQIQLTPLGQLIRPRLLNAFEETARVRQEAQLYVAGGLMSFHLGVDRTAPPDRIRALVETVHEAETARLKVTRASGADLVAMVTGGELDAAVTAAPICPPDFHRERLYTDEFIAVMAPTHPLAEQSSISLTDLAGVTLALNRDTDFLDHLPEASAATLKSLVVFGHESRALQDDLVRNGKALCVQTISAAIPEGAAIRPLEPAHKERPDLHVVYARKMVARPKIFSQLIIA